MKTLVLTSPHMRGPDVERAQRTLNGANTYDHDYFGGQVDGEFGPVTAASARQAKFWLGYPEADLLPIYGDKLHGFLTGKVPLPADYAARRKYRIANQGDDGKTLGEKAVAYAAKYVGKTEQPLGSNHFPGITDWYGMGDVPYCMEGVTRSYIEAGSKAAFQRGARWSYVPFFVSAAREGSYGLRVVSFAGARKGDPVAFDWDGGVADHVGLFVEKLSPTTFKTIEFNTSPTDAGSQSNGGGCYWKVRNVAQVEAFVRVER